MLPSNLRAAIQEVIVLCEKILSERDATLGRALLFQLASILPVEIIRDIFVLCSPQTMSIEDARSHIVKVSDAAMIQVLINSSVRYPDADILKLIEALKNLYTSHIESDTLRRN